MKEIFPYCVYLVLLTLFFTFSNLSDVRRESNLISLPDNSIIAIGDHNYHKFYNMTEYTFAADKKSGEIIKKWGLIGGINEIGTVTAEKDGSISFYTTPRKGQAKCLIQNVETKKIVFSDYILDEPKTLPLEEGSYCIFVVTDEFSGKCTIGYQNAIFTKT